MLRVVIVHSIAIQYTFLALKLVKSLCSAICFAMLVRYNGGIIQEEDFSLCLQPP